MSKQMKKKWKQPSFVILVRKNQFKELSVLSACKVNRSDAGAISQFWNHTSCGSSGCGKCNSYDNS